MKNFGRAFEHGGVRYLLISGQAAVLYGAAEFSEDIDIWVEPTPSNWRRFLNALRDCRARIYKLTPPLQLSYARRGHGFHFTLPADKFSPAYLDVMGRPPRVRDFGTCHARCRYHMTSWGYLPVVSVEDLVLLKRTRRLADYDVINRLVSGSTPGTEQFLRSSFDASGLVSCVMSTPGALAVARKVRRPALLPFRRWRDANAPPPRGLRAAVQEAVLKEIALHQRADLRYWSPILSELRDLRRRGRLSPMGELV